MFLGYFFFVWGLVQRFECILFFRGVFGAVFFSGVAGCGFVGFLDFIVRYG